MTVNLTGWWAKVVNFLGNYAEDALIISGTCLISAFVIFLIMYVIERRSEIASVKKLNLYANLSTLLLLIGLYQIFTLFVLKETESAERALFYFRLSYAFGIPTIPIFLKVVLTLTIGRYTDIQSPKSRIKKFWKKLTKLTWIPMWGLAGVVWCANWLDIFFSSNFFLSLRAVPLKNSRVPLTGEFSDKVKLLGIPLFPFLWGVALFLAIAMILSYIVRVIWYDKKEGTLKFLAGLRDPKPTVKWIKTFSLLSVMTIGFLLFQGFQGYDWPGSFPIVAYSNFFTFFAIIFILFGEVFGAREETLRVYSDAFISNINARSYMTISHEMGTPVMLLRDLLNRMGCEFKEKMDDDTYAISKKTAGEFLAAIKENEGQLNKLFRIDENLRQRVGILKGNMVEVSLKEIVEEAKTVTTLHSSGKNIDFAIIPDEKEDRVKIVLEQMVIILRNIIDNAVDAVSSKKGRIEISWKIADQVVIQVRDNGKGIPRKHLKRVGQLFFTTKEQTGGSGLGLSIVKNFLKEINGTLNIQSRLNEGTTVEIRFPNILRQGEQT